MVGGNTNGLGNVSKMDKITIKEEEERVRAHVISLKWNYLINTLRNFFGFFNVGTIQGGRARGFLWASFIQGRPGIH